MKSICFFIESLSHSAGTERITVDVANALVKSKEYVVYFLLLDENTNSFFEVDPHISVYTLRTSFSEKRKSIIRMRKWLKLYRPDFIVNVAFQMATISLMAVVGFSCKIITWDHFFLTAGSRLGYLMRLLSAFWGYKQIVLTETDREAYPSFLQKKVICIPNFTNLNPEDKRSSLSAKIVLSVGRLTPSKGYDLLIKAWSDIVKDFPDWKLRIVGGGDELETLNRLIEKYNLLNYVSILPPTKEILSYYLDASLYVLSSYYESFGLVLIEAKSCGLPIIAFDCPLGPKDIVRDQIDGKLVKVGDTKTLVENMSFLLQSIDIRKKFGEEAFWDYKKRWSEKAIILRWKNILK